MKRRRPIKDVGRTRAGTIRRKPAKSRKDDQIRIRVTKTQKRILSKAAEQAGLDVSSWLRMLALREAGQSPE